MTTQISRRTLACSVLAGIAAVPVASLPAFAATDPVFASIERLKAAHTYHGECLVRADDLEQKIWKRRDANLAVPRKDWDEVDSLRDIGSETACTACREFLTTVPGTDSGASAMTWFFLENHGSNGLQVFEQEEAADLIETLAAYFDGRPRQQTALWRDAVN